MNQTTAFLVILFCFVLIAESKFIAVLGPKTEIAEFNVSSGNMTRIGSFQSNPPQTHQQWQVTNFKAVDPARKRIYFAYEDIISAITSVFYYDIETGKSLQGPFFSFRLRGLHFDVKQKRLFALTDFEPGRAESAVIELNRDTLDKQGVIVSVTQFGVINMPSTFDQQKGWISFTMYNFSQDAHYIITVDTHNQGEKAIVYSPQIDKKYWHILTIAFDENNQRMIALWNQNSYTPLKMLVLDRATGQYDFTYNVTVVDWRKARDAMSDAPISFAKDYVNSQLVSVITGKSFTQLVVVLDLTTVSLVYTKSYPYPGIGYDIVFAYLE